VAALAAFLARTPLRLVLIARRRERGGRTPVDPARVGLAGRVALVECLGLGAALSLAARLAADPWWWLPGILAGPLLAVALWYDMRSLSRQLVPEVVGSIAIGSVAAMAALAGGANLGLAMGLWLIQAARVSTSIPHVRAQIQRLHAGPADAAPMLIGDVVAILLAGAAVLSEMSLITGAFAVLGLVAVQRVTVSRPPRPAKILGVRQAVLGFSVVGITAAGVWLA
jgi:hypothetical protein